MATPPAVSEWLQIHYPRPRVDQQWLEDCFEWITGPEGKNLSPATSMPEILAELEVQLLSSDLSSSMVPGTGLPAGVATMNGTRFTGPPILVSIVSMTEIGHSALSLQRTKETREERIQAGETELDGDEDGADGERIVGGKIPRFPRGMLKFELTDGNITLKAIEYRPLQGLELGVTPLGFKILLKDVLVRAGMVFLEPGTIELRGHCDADLDAQRDLILSRDLRQRLGQPEPPEAPEQANARLPLPVPDPPLPPAPRAALHDIPVSLASTSGRRPDEHSHDDDERQPQRRKVPQRMPEPDAPPRPQDQPTTSSFFPPAGSTPDQQALQASLRLTPSRMTTSIVKNDDHTQTSDLSSLVDGRSGGSKASKGKEKEVSSPHLMEVDPGSDYDYFGMDDDILAAIELEEIRIGEPGAMRGPAGPAGSSKTSINGRPQALGSHFSPDIIDVDDEDPHSIPGINDGGGGRGPGRIADIDLEDDDKENTPVPTRNVRRRVTPSPFSSTRGDGRVDTADLRSIEAMIDRELAACGAEPPRAGSAAKSSSSQRGRPYRNSKPGQNLGVIEISDSD